jgi:hypothetical protein
MKVIKYISGNTYDNRNDIIDNYEIVSDDYDVINSNMEDVTSRNTLSVFHSIGKISYRVFRESLISNVLPNWNNLSYEDKEDLIYDRVYPSNLTEEEIINFVSSEDEWNTIKNTKTEFEYINDVEKKVENNFYYESNEIENTNSTSYQTYYDINNDFSGVLYEIEFNVIHACDDKKDGSMVRFLINDVLIGTEVYGNSDNRLSSDYILSAKTLGENTSIRVEFKSEKKGTSYIKYSSILIKQI